MKASELHPNPQNPRKISDEQLEMLQHSLEEFGDLSGIVFNRNTQRLVGGHQRTKFLPPDAEINITERFIPPTRIGTVATDWVNFNGEKLQYREVEWDEQKEKAANIAANKHGGEWDFPQLAEWINELDAANYPMDLVGFTTPEIENIMTYTPKEEPKSDEDEVPHTPQIPKTKMGDLYLLGEHRLLCGDSTDSSQVARLMNGEKADMVFTDPPYGVSYTDKNEYLNSLGNGHRLTKAIENDSKTIPEMFDLWSAVFNLTAEACHDRASYYICSPQGGELMMMMQAIDQSPWSLKHTLIWNKNNHVLGRCDYHYKHEPILYGWKKKGVHDFLGIGPHTKSVWDVPKPNNSDLHPTMKPIELMENAILNSAKTGAIILDLFLGSGSTLIACEKTNRKCYGMEIDPLYCDVIVERWAKYTGKDPVREDGIPWSAISPPTAIE